jgi:hypothetical protein
MEISEIQHIKKDICFLYHELSEYSGMMGDLDYSGLYDRPYWKFIDVDADPFVLHGCLIMILAMVWDWIDGSGNFIEDKIIFYQNAIKTLYGQSEEEYRLIETVKKGLAIVSKEEIKDQGFESDTHWVYQTFVKGYFQERAKNS